MYSYNPYYEKHLAHFGIKHKSGRYPWGSGERPYQGDTNTPWNNDSNGYRPLIKQYRDAENDIRNQVLIDKHTGKTYSEGYREKRLEAERQENQYYNDRYDSMRKKFNDNADFFLKNFDFLDQDILDTNIKDLF